MDFKGKLKKFVHRKDAVEVINEDEVEQKPENEIIVESENKKDK